MSKELCKAINEADEKIVLDLESKDYMFKDKILEAFCPAKKNGGKRECDSNGLKVASAFIALLKYFKSIDDYEDNLKNDKLAEYAILWLNYKIRQNKKIEAGINDIYDMITTNEWFTEHRQDTDKKKDMMKFFYTYLNNLYALLKGICDTINKCSESSSTNECIKSAERCVSLYQYCVNNCPWKRNYNLYCSVLSHLKSDYDKFRENHNNLPEMKLPNGIESCDSLCEKKKQESESKKQTSEQPEQVTTSEDSLPVRSQIKLADSREEPQSSISVQMDKSNSITPQSVIPTSINNGNKLPYIAVPFILIPIILVISYKFLAPAWRKRMKKKNMKKIINLCDKKKAKNGVTNVFIEKNQLE
ncbi:CIR protein [Plasmodium chabaudi chabaudi]|uniref:CIR protein n=1 Tax=Plasmodium chabaudi chabaudi TaxID=31271 RepID=A0A4V6M8U7_PLACU|nr:CIR protein [Plasmodium chabaudi chabaudi]VTZ66931.1 CIR protein [Plasmodium chabaudi chabaudi]|eukprot:XP_016653136.1 CIR protein [Plasmodium chabaudi chabaudi]